MKSPIFAVYGASGHGREIMPIARDCLRAKNFATDRLFFIDDNPAATSVNGHEIIRYLDFLKIAASERHVAIAIANGRIRSRLAEQIVLDDIEEWSLQASNVVVLDDVNIGLGAQLSPFVTLTSNITIGRQFQANVYSHVSHDCVIGDYVTFAPGVRCNGNVVVEDFAYIGAGAVIRQGAPGNPLVIGKGAVVGMGAVVTKSVAPGTVVVGNPAKVFIKG